LFEKEERKQKGEFDFFLVLWRQDAYANMKIS